MTGFSEDKYIHERKLEHIKVVLGEDVNYRKTTWFEYVHLIHNSLPEIDLDSIDMKVVFLDREFDYPILIDSMTGGARLAKEINKDLVLLASKYNIPVSCGSQKAGLLNKDVIDTYKVMRDECSDCFIIGNIGGHDLADDPGRLAEMVVSMIEADALAIHLNPLQEAVQKGSGIDYSNVLDIIAKVVDSLDVPIIVKETGAGISMGVAKALEKVGVDAINVAGAGGTSWSAVEIIRNRLREKTFLAKVGEAFWDWGIPTAASLLEVARSVDIPVIASGGIRNGIDIIKSLVLGASISGMAQPFLRAYFDGQLEEFINRIIYEVRIGMFLVGAPNINILREDIPYVITGDLLEWARQRGLLGGGMVVSD
jgi:isopentenyl-diphosphate delta-isomerase